MLDCFYVFHIIANYDLLGLLHLLTEFFDFQMQLQQYELLICEVLAVRNLILEIHLINNQFQKLVLDNSSEVARFD